MTARIIDPTYGKISIHALLAESDTSVLPTIPAPAISIHALLAESDGNFITNELLTALFLSTLSLRRATYFRGEAL